MTWMWLEGWNKDGKPIFRYKSYSELAVLTKDGDLIPIGGETE